MNQRTDYRQVPNFNLIPLEYREPTISFLRLSLRLLLVLLIAAQVLFIHNLYQERFTFEATIASAQQKIQQIDQKLKAANAKKTEAKKIEATIESLEKERRTLEDDWRELVMKQPDWWRVMTAFFWQPQGVELSSIRMQDATQVSATGTASDYAALFEYRRLLLSSPAISRIISLSLKSEKAGTSISFSLVAEVKMRFE